MTIMVEGLDYETEAEALADLVIRLQSAKSLRDHAISSSSNAWNRYNTQRQLLVKMFNALGDAIYMSPEWYVAFPEEDS